MKYFLDTNIIIDILEKKADVLEKLEAILLESDSELFINRLILLETLRTIHFNHKKIFREAEETLKFFRQLDIKPAIYNRAIEFSRFCHSRGVRLKGKCEAIDFIHFMTAKYYNLKIISNDKDLEKLEKQYSEFLNIKSKNI